MIDSLQVRGSEQKGVGMNTQGFDIAMIGKWIGLAIIGIGILFTLWDMADLPDGYGGDDKFRYLVENSLRWLASGGLVFLAAEILDRVKNKA